MAEAPKNWTPDVQKDADVRAHATDIPECYVGWKHQAQCDTPITMVKQDFDEKGQPSDTHIKVGDTWYSHEKLHEKFPEFTADSWGTIKTKIETAYGEYATAANKAKAFRGSVDNLGWKTQGLHKQADGSYTPDALEAYAGHDRQRQTCRAQAHLRQHRRDPKDGEEDRHRSSDGRADMGAA